METYFLYIPPVMALFSLLMLFATVQTYKYSYANAKNVFHGGRPKETYTLLIYASVRILVFSGLILLIYGLAFAFTKTITILRFVLVLAGIAGTLFVAIGHLLESRKSSDFKKWHGMYTIPMLEEILHGRALYKKLVIGQIVTAIFSSLLAITY